MGACVIQTTGGQIVRRVSINADTLDKVADALGIPPAEREQFIAGTEAIHIYRGDRAAPSVPPPQQGGNQP
jgi:hypothetical protein